MTKEELSEKLKLAKTPQERRALLEEYRDYILKTTTVRQRYKEMDRFIRRIRKIGGSLIAKRREE
jgi:hypothetical protein